MMSLVAKRFDEPRPASRCGCSSRIAPALPMATSAAISFIVDDAVAVMRWLLETPKVSGMFNVGTGQARSFKRSGVGDVQRARPRPNIEYIADAGNDPRQLPVFHRGVGR